MIRWPARAKLPTSPGSAGAVVVPDAPRTGPGSAVPATTGTSYVAAEARHPQQGDGAAGHDRRRGLLARGPSSAPPLGRRRGRPRPTASAVRRPPARRSAARRRRCRRTGSRRSRGTPGPRRAAGSRGSSARRAAPGGPYVRHLRGVRRRRRRAWTSCSSRSARPVVAGSGSGLDRRLGVPVEHPPRRHGWPRARPAARRPRGDRRRRGPASHRRRRPPAGREPPGLPGFRRGDHARPRRFTIEARSRTASTRRISRAVAPTVPPVARAGDLQHPLAGHLSQWQPQELRRRKSVGNLTVSAGRSGSAIRRSSKSTLAAPISSARWAAQVKRGRTGRPRESRRTRPGRFPPAERFRGCAAPA